MGGVVITYLGIDIGGTKVAFRAEGDGGWSHEAAFRWPPPGDADADLAALGRAVAAVCDRARRPFDAVGVALPAALDAAGRVTAWPNRPQWEGLALRAALGELFPGAGVHCADDGDLAAVAEADRAGCRNVVYLGVGTGVGGGIVVDGRSVPGPRHGSCELGHVVADPAGPRCDCGRTGCLQAIASGPATLRRASELRGAPVDFDELRAGLAADEPWAVSAVRTAAAALATAAVGLGELVRPERVVVGGGFAMGLPGFVAEVARHTRSLGRPGFPAPPVEEAALGGLSSLHGALLLAKREGSTC